MCEKYIHWRNTFVPLKHKMRRFLKKKSNVILKFCVIWEPMQNFIQSDIYKKTGQGAIFKKITWQCRKSTMKLYLFILLKPSELFLKIWEILNGNCILSLKNEERLNPHKSISKKCLYTRAGRNCRFSKNFKMVDILIVTYII